LASKIVNEKSFSGNMMMWIYLLSLLQHVTASAQTLGAFGGYGTFQGNYSTVLKDPANWAQSLEAIVQHNTDLRHWGARSLALHLSVASTLLVALRFNQTASSSSSSKTQALWKRFLQDRTPLMQGTVSSDFLATINFRGQAEPSNVPEWTLLTLCFLKRPIASLPSSDGEVAVDPVGSYLQTLQTLSREAAVIPGYLDLVARQLSDLLELYPTSRNQVLQLFLKNQPPELIYGLRAHPGSSTALGELLRPLPASTPVAISSSSAFVLHPRHYAFARGRSALTDGKSFRLDYGADSWTITVQNLDTGRDLTLLRLALEADGLSWGLQASVVPRKRTAAIKVDPANGSSHSDDEDERGTQVYLVVVGDSQPLTDFLFQTILPRLSVHYTGELLIWLQATLQASPSYVVPVMFALTGQQQ
jgi:hypothetical protein